MVPEPHVFEQDPHDPQLNHLASLMFSKTSDWVACELDSTCEEYRLIQHMNKYIHSRQYVILTNY